MLMESKHNFSSTQFDLPEKLANEIIKWGESHIDDNDLYEEDHTMGRQYDLHVTTLYGLHSDNPEPVRKLLKNQNHFEVQLGKISLFTTNDNFDVLIVEVHGDELHELHHKLTKIPHSSTHPVYKPHVTIAYVKKGTCKNLKNAEPFKNKICKVNNLIFSSKDRKKTVIPFKNTAN